MRIRIKKVRDDIPTPSYAYTGDAGYDLIAGEDKVIEPGQTVKIPTGLAFEIAEGYEMQVRPRSGVTFRSKLRVQLGTIDSNFRGEVCVIVDNVANPIYVLEYDTDLMGNKYNYRIENKRTGWIKHIDGNIYADRGFGQLKSDTYVIRKGDRIAQGIIAPVVQANFEVVDELGETNRGTGGFGSSGVKS